MKIKALVEDTPDGYIVVYRHFEQEDDTYPRLLPLANFGLYQSAAIEFCRYINLCERADIDRRIKLWAASYKRGVKYSYPKITPSGMVILPRQKVYE